MDFFQKLMNNEIKAGSELNIRNEQRQKRDYSKAIPKIKREAGKASKLLIFKEYVFPFDITTGDTDKFNDEFRWRYASGQGSILKAIKKICNENADLKAMYMAKASQANWDTSDVNNINEADIEFFRRFSTVETFTYPVVHVNIPLFTNGSFGRDFLLDIQRDPLTDEIIGEVPPVLQVRQLFSDLCFEQVQALKKENANSARPLTEKEIKEKVKSIYQKNPVSDEIRKNTLLAIEIPLSDKSRMIDGYSLKGATMNDIGAKLVRISKTDEIMKELKQIEDGIRTDNDLYPDFYEIDMMCPTQFSDELELYKKTSYQVVPITPLSKFPGVDDFLNAVSEYRDSTADSIDKIMTASVRLRKLSADDNDNLIEAAGRLIDVESPYLTSKVINRHANLLTQALGSKGDMLLVQAQCGMKPEGDLDEEEAKKEYKQTSVSILQEMSAMGGNDLDEDDDLED